MTVSKNSDLAWPPGPLRIRFTPAARASETASLMSSQKTKPCVTLVTQGRVRVCEDVVRDAANAKEVRGVVVFTRFPLTSD